ncbi:transporter substrate-binding domain-containing protein [Pseudomonas mandelii]|uniref:transporter substrate-binding domain-containing protein n=1 Tax=Pseudomonas mandelii TaxID=75612 RepID=UPI003C72B03D
MDRPLKCFLIVLLVLCPFWMVSSAASQNDALQLLGRSKVEHYSVSLDEADWRWLRQKGTLRLGISTPDYPPFDITSNGRNYEGMTADYVKLLSELLGIQIEIRRFDSRAKVVEALKNKELDLLGTANCFEEIDPDLFMSSSYANDQPTLVTRNDDRLPPNMNLAGKKIAMLYHYLPPQQVRDFYPDADLQLYPSTLSAMGAVAFGKADVYLGDAISANYLITRNYLSNMQLTGFSAMEGSRFAFAMPRENNPLHRIVNAALAAIPLNERLDILRRWGATEISIPGQRLLQLTEREQRWMDEHPQVKVAVVESFLPMSFFDGQGEFRGISADVLAKISLRTGLKFEVVRSHSLAQVFDQLRGGKVDALAAITPSPDREDEMRFTRPYLTTPYVLVSRMDKGSPGILEELAGKKLALIKGNILREFLTTRYPQIQIVDADNAAQAMEMVASGKVEGAINSLLSARYMISRQYRDRLQVSSTVGDLPSRVSLATGRGALELYSILEKALLSISPEEMGELANRWHSDVIVEDSYWLRNRALILQGFAVASVLLLLALGWITYLRKLIRKREAAELALNNQLEFMRVLIDGTPHPIYVRDREGRMVICNAGYLDVFGLKREAAMNKRITETTFANPEEARSYHDEYLKVMSSGSSRIEDRQLTLANGQLITIYHWMLPYRDMNGVVIGMIAGWIDVSERQRLLGLVEEAREAADEARHIADNANRAKTTFLATISHEIRTPMNAIIGMLELALKKADQGVLDRFAIEVASGAALGLQDLIGDILDIARIESGKLSLAPERTNLRELMESLVRIFDGLARQKHLQLLLDLDTHINCDVLIDPLRFKQIVSNLLSNAIKFTTEGQIHLILEVLPSSATGYLSVRLRVEDSGMGISAQDQERLFSPFIQASNNDQSARVGSGLGLVISRTLCEMMGGVLGLRSELGKGTEIEVLLELPVLQALPERKAPSVVPQSLHQVLSILIVDDYPANRQLLSKQLGYLGHQIIECEDGAHGLRAWRNNRVDVVITDCNMPIMNGYAMARAIRIEEQQRGKSRCLIMGFTANALPDEKDRCLEAGMDDCLFKPISLKALSNRLSLVNVPIVSSVVEGAELMQSAAFDFSNLDQLVGGDIEAMKSLLGDLAQSNAEDLARLPVIFFEEDFRSLSDLAHKIKGGARIIKAHGLIAACEQLEVVCEGLAGDEALELAVASLNEEMKALATSLDIRLGKTDICI